MTAEVRTVVRSAPQVTEEPAGLLLPVYERPAIGVHPPLDFTGYRSTALRHPKRPLVLLPHRLTEVTGPLLGNDLITPRPEYGFPGLKAGDGWCVCVEPWKRSFEAGVMAPVRLEATHERALEVVTLEMLLKSARLN